MMKRRVAFGALAAQPEISLTATRTRKLFVVPWGRISVQRLRWILVFLLLGVAAFVSVVPRVDLPETAFNEADAPLTLATPARPNIQLTRFAADRIAVLPVLSLDYIGYLVGNLVLAPVTTVSQSRSLSLQDLLCTFLI